MSQKSQVSGRSITYGRTYGLTWNFWVMSHNFKYNMTQYDKPLGGAHARQTLQLAGHCLGNCWFESQAPQTKLCPGLCASASLLFCQSNFWFLLANFLQPEFQFFISLWYFWICFVHKYIGLLGQNLPQI